MCLTFGHQETARLSRCQGPRNTVGVGSYHMKNVRVDLNTVLSTHNERVEVKLPVMPAGSFEVRSVMRGNTLGKFTGKRFGHRIAIRLPAKDKVEVLKVCLGAGPQTHTA